MGQVWGLQTCLVGNAYPEPHILYKILHRSPNSSTSREAAAPVDPAATRVLSHAQNHRGSGGPGCCNQCVFCPAQTLPQLSLLAPERLILQVPGAHVGRAPIALSMSVQPLFLALRLFVGGLNMPVLPHHSLGPSSLVFSLPFASTVLTFPTFSPFLFQSLPIYPSSS